MTLKFPIQEYFHGRKLQQNNGTGPNKFDHLMYTHYYHSFFILRGLNRGARKQSGPDKLACSQYAINKETKLKKKHTGCIKKLIKSGPVVE